MTENYAFFLTIKLNKINCIVGTTLKEKTIIWHPIHILIYSNKC